MAIVSIGIPTFNNAETVAETIYSLQAQSFTEWECIITDDSDSNRTIFAVKEAIGCDLRFTVIKNSQRLGAAENWNKTLSLANGKYFKLLCADDLLSRNALLLQFQALEKNPNSVICTGRRSIINSSGSVLIKNRGLVTSSASLTANKATNLFVYRGSNFFGEPSFAMFKTDVLRNMGGFNGSWSYLIDVEAYLRCLGSGDLVALNENIGSFRVSSNSWSVSLMGQQRRELLRCIDYAISLPYSSSSKFEIAIGKMRANISSQIRIVLFKFLLSKRQKTIVSN